MNNTNEKIKDDVLASIRRNISRIGGRNPMVGNGLPNFDWHYRDDYFWTDAFWTGQLWLAYGLTGEQPFRSCAEMRNPLLEEVLNNPLWIDHDLGFTFSLIAVANYKLTGCLDEKTLALRGADALRNRFNYCGNYIQAWNAMPNDPAHGELVQGKIIIDCMQNLGLLMWAYNETGIKSYRDIALLQAETSANYLVREDFSTYHTFDFDPKTGKPLRGSTHQGYSDESCWSRGQAWAIHGFAQLAETTGDMQYAETSAKLVDFVEQHITDDYVPVWDYRLPANEPQHKDSSAGAITSAGLFILADVFKHNGELDKADKYHRFAMKMLEGLHLHCDLTQVEHAQGLLSGAASFVNEGYRDDKPHLYDGMLPYGDYYYFEAILRALNYKKFFWK